MTTTLESTLQLPATFQVIPQLAHSLGASPGDGGFDGQMTIGAGRQIDIFGNGWRIGEFLVSDAEVQFDGGETSTNPARLVMMNNALTFAHGTLNVEGYTELDGTGSFVFEAGFETNIASGGQLSTRALAILWRCTSSNLL